MFDFGFSEVLLTSVIALIVLGPEKLPRAASQVGRWVGRARAMARQFREQLEEEVNLENVKRAHKEEDARREAETKQAAGDGTAAGQSSTGTDAAGGQGASAAEAPAATYQAREGHGPESVPKDQVTEGHGPGSVSMGQATESHGPEGMAEPAPEGHDSTQAASPYIQPAASPNAPFDPRTSQDPSTFHADAVSAGHSAAEGDGAYASTTTATSVVPVGAHATTTPDHPTPHE